MTELFMTIGDMSLRASYVIVCVIIMRLFFCMVNVPRRITYFLWVIVLLRLLVPSFYLSDHSVIPPELTASFTQEWGDDYIGNTQIIHDTAEGFDTAVHYGNRVITDSSGGQYVVTGADGVSQPKTMKNTVYPVLTGVWLIGMAVMVLWNGAAMVRLKRRLDEAVSIAGDVFIADGIDTAFVLGFLNPRIYLPSTLTAEQQECILLHERHHIRRGDHMIKVIAFGTLCIHWFNPLVWAAFAFAMEDMELSCDEAVTGSMDESAKTRYAQTLLDLTAGHRRFSVAPVAFGEGSTGQRIRHVYAYKEPAKWLSILLLVIVAVSMLGYLTDPYGEADPQSLGPAPYRIEQLIYSKYPAADEADWDGRYFYLTTGKTAVMEQSDGTVTPMGTWSGSVEVDDPDNEQWETLLETETGKAFDDIRCAIIIEADEHPEQFYLLTRHGYADEPVNAYLSCVSRESGVLWTVSTRPMLKFFGSQEETAFYEYCLESMGLTEVEVFGFQHRNRMETRLFREYAAEAYRFVGFTCDGGARAGWALFDPSDGYNWAEFTGQMQIHDVDTNNGMIISSAPATLNDTGEITDDTACDVILVLNPEVARVTALFDNNVRYSWPLESTPVIVVMPWEYQGKSQTYLYFQDKNGSLISDSENTQATDQEQLLLDNFGKLESIALRCLDDPMDAASNNVWIYGIKDVAVFDGEHPMVQFETYGFNHQYSGLYYSPDDVPLAFQNIDAALFETDDGWAWQAEGDNHGTTQRITKYWFSYNANL